jgi:hypothetical protein
MNTTTAATTTTTATAETKESKTIPEEYLQVVDIAVKRLGGSSIDSRDVKFSEFPEGYKYIQAITRNGSDGYLRLDHILYSNNFNLQSENKTYEYPIRGMGACIVYHPTEKHRNFILSMNRPTYNSYSTCQIKNNRFKIDELKQQGYAGVIYLTSNYTDSMNKIIYCVDCSTFRELR